MHIPTNILKGSLSLWQVPHQQFFHLHQFFSHPRVLRHINFLLLIQFLENNLQFAL